MQNLFLNFSAKYVARELGAYDVLLDIFLQYILEYII